MIPMENPATAVWLWCPRSRCWGEHLASYSRIAASRKDRLKRTHRDYRSGHPRCRRARFREESKKLPTNHTKNRMDFFGDAFHSCFWCDAWLTFSARITRSGVGSEHSAAGRWRRRIGPNSTRIKAAGSRCFRAARRTLAVLTRAIRSGHWMGSSSGRPQRSNSRRRSARCSTVWKSNTQEPAR